VPGVHKAHLNFLVEMYDLVVFTSHKILQDPQSIFHGIGRNEFLFPRPFSFPVPPFCLEHLNMGAVAEHNVAQVTGGFRGIDISVEAFGIEGRQVTRMVNVCVGEENKVNVTGIYRYFNIFIVTGALFHPAVNQEFTSVRLH